MEGPAIQNRAPGKRRGPCARGGRAWPSNRDVGGRPQGSADREELCGTGKRL